MPIRPIGTSIPVITNDENIQQPSTQRNRSKGIAESRDSFEPHKASGVTGLFGTPLIGTLIGSAIGESANNDADETRIRESGPRITLLQSTNTNDEASDIAKKQKDLINNEKEARRQTISLKKPDSD
jgi:hypothetical protein